jgi:sec-independent protein translocase protein TatA
VVGYISSDNILIGKNMFGLGPLELVVIGVIAVMLFGKQLPEVGLRVGKSLSELRRQWSTISRDLDVTGEAKGHHVQSRNQKRRLPNQFDDQEDTPTGPSFEPPSSPEV